LLEKVYLSYVFNGLFVIIMRYSTTKLIMNAISRVKLRRQQEIQDVEFDNIIDSFIVRKEGVEPLELSKITGHNIETMLNYYKRLDVESAGKSPPKIELKATRRIKFKSIISSNSELIFSK
tara:strand:- start:574 stop:936 length:363 start_codon:yes stop_codon:yes gene_type:complete